jgi:hypothetical protein
MAELIKFVSYCTALLFYKSCVVNVIFKYCEFLSHETRTSYFQSVLSLRASGHWIESYVSKNLFVCLFRFLLGIVNFFLTHNFIVITKPLSMGQIRTMFLRLIK